MLLVLEDLHWSDPTSLGLTELLPRRLANAQVGMLLTAREDEPGSLFQGTLLQLRRARTLNLEVPLNSLETDRVAEMVEAIVGMRPAKPVATVLQDRTDGNPFFVEELVAIVWQSGDADTALASTAVPRSIEEAVIRRFEDLDPDTRLVASVMAVIGLRTSPELVRSICNLPEARLLSALETLVHRQIIVEHDRGAGRPSLFAFRHVLTRDAIYGRVLGARKRALHMAIGHAPGESGGLTDRSAAPDGDLAYHFHAAGEWRKALAHGMKAGNAARAVHAVAEALGHYRRALDAALQLADPLTMELDLLCGECLALLGEFDSAQQHLEAALVEARKRDDLQTQQASLY
ncbi:MAG: hypothetical protein HY682_10580 [Chloroflexi bacterium]|nr:hypothetical protein [Chloroflexota bacterium]